MYEQCRAFEGQLKLAAKWLKPIVIHSRDAYDQTFKLMKQVNSSFYPDEDRNQKYESLISIRLIFCVE
jgi:Tat protein secretion system quality control protein TatD with DNase activity